MTKPKKAVRAANSDPIQAPPESPAVRRHRGPTEIDKRVGAAIRRLRVQRKLTLSEASQALNLSHQQFQKYETGQNRVSVGTAIAIAELLQVPITLLLEGVANDNQRSTVDWSVRTRELREECAFLLSRVDSEQQLKQISRVIRAIIS